MQSIKNYYRIMAGAKSVHSDLCFSEGFIGGDWGIRRDLSGSLPEQWKDFNKAFIPVYLETYPDKSKIAAGLACGMLHVICKGMVIGDIVLCPNGSGIYRVGEVVSEYYYQAGFPLPHRRKIKWYEGSISRDEMTQELKSSTGSIGTVSTITKHSKELKILIEGNQPPQLHHADQTVEDPGVFALEKHLEDFLVANWPSTELGKDFDIFCEDGELVGQQYPSDTGPIDILAISKDKNTLLVVELKRGRASDNVVGQIQRYMGYVKDELCEAHQSVRGAIIALEDDLRLKRALSVTQRIDYYRYEVSFRLFKHH